MCKDSSDLGNPDLDTQGLAFNLLLGTGSSHWLRKSFRVFIFQVIKQRSSWLFLHVHKPCSIKVSMKLSKILLLKSTYHGASSVHSSHECQINFRLQCLPASLQMLCEKISINARRIHWTFKFLEVLKTSKLTILAHMYGFCSNVKRFCSFSCMTWSFLN